MNPFISLDDDLKDGTPKDDDGRHFQAPLHEIIYRNALQIDRYTDGLIEIQIES
jgi:hypothetical protein